MSWVWINIDLKFGTDSNWGWRNLNLVEFWDFIHFDIRPDETIFLANDIFRRLMKLFLFGIFCFCFFTSTTKVSADVKSAANSNLVKSKQEDESQCIKIRILKLGFIFYKYTINCIILKFGLSFSKTQDKSHFWKWYLSLTEICT